MENVLKKSHIQYLIDNRNGYLVLAVGSIILNILLCAVIYCSLGYEKTIFVPPTISREFWVSENSISPEYLSSMSLFLADIRFNLTPSNASLQRELFLRYVEPSNYEKIKAELIEEEDHLKKEHVSTSFYVTDVRVDAKNKVARISGDIQYIIGESLQPMQHVIYQINYRFSSGRLMVSSLEEVKDHA